MMMIKQLLAIVAIVAIFGLVCGCTSSAPDNATVGISTANSTTINSTTINSTTLVTPDSTADTQETIISPANCTDDCCC